MNPVLYGREETLLVSESRTQTFVGEKQILQTGRLGHWYSGFCLVQPKPACNTVQAFMEGQEAAAGVPLSLLSGVILGITPGHSASLPAPQYWR